MKISILGGGGFLGRKVAARLAHDGKLGDRPLTGLTLFDLAEPPKPAAAFPVTAVAGDIVELPEAAIPPGTDVVFHLAAVVSAQAEADYDLGRRVNLRGTDAVIDACRRLVAAGRKPPRVVFTSSVASFSGGQDARARRRCPPGAGEQLWRAEGGGGADPGRRLAPRLPRCGVASGCPR